MIGVKELNMPKDCEECQFSGRFTYVCTLLHKEYYSKEGPRAEWCPLVDIK